MAGASAALRTRVSRVLATMLLCLLAVLVAAPDWVAPMSPLAVDPAKALQPPSAHHWFGTDDVGRDLFSRVVHGARITLGLVAGALFVSALLGGLLGLVAGFVGGKLDLAAARAVDSLLRWRPSTWARWPIGDQGCAS